ncbi:hypothetical protein RJT34_11413 [Clitoria ternatea]|uniref:Uncharacterized protein n=1 Tax=Clitoria ternatea TaxID=43366 RepID=A0AAN9JLW4_CLITE
MVLNRVAIIIIAVCIPRCRFHNLIREKVGQNPTWHRLTNLTGTHENRRGRRTPLSNVPGSQSNAQTPFYKPFHVRHVTFGVSTIYGTTCYPPFLYFRRCHHLFPDIISLSKPFAFFLSLNQLSAPFSNSRNLYCVISRLGF